MNTPICDFVRRYAENDALRLHMPGHKGRGQLGIEQFDITEIDGVLDVHHIHIRSIDGRNNYVTMHIVTDSDAATIKRAVRSELAEHGITHATLELEASGEDCVEVNCVVEEITRTGHHHHHH